MDDDMEGFSSIKDWFFKWMDAILFREWKFYFHT